jgi:hypothetical protein
VQKSRPTRFVLRVILATIEVGLSADNPTALVFSRFFQVFLDFSFGLRMLWKMSSKHKPDREGLYYGLAVRVTRARTSKLRKPSRLNQPIMTCGTWLALPWARVSGEQASTRSHLVSQFWKNTCTINYATNNRNNRGTRLLSKPRPVPQSSRACGGRCNCVTKSD